MDRRAQSLTPEGALDIPRHRNGHRLNLSCLRPREELWVRAAGDLHRLMVRGETPNPRSASPRRSRVEGAFGQLKFNHGDAARDKIRMFGIQKFALIFGLKAAATNIKLIRSFNERLEDEANSS